MVSQITIHGETRVAGCLPRASSFGEVCRVFADDFATIPRDQWDAMLNAITLRPYVNHIFNQRSVGSCAAESSTQGLQVIRAVNNQPFVKLNPWSVYHFTSGGRDNGSSIDSNLVQLREYGAVPMDDWKRSDGWRKIPMPNWRELAEPYRICEFWDIENILEFGSALLLGFPVVFGWEGHSVLAVALKDSRTLIYANSWGEDWNNGGFSTLPLASVNFNYGAFAPRTGTLTISA